MKEQTTNEAIASLKSDFENFQKDVDRQFKDLMDKIKPKFTTVQITKGLCTLMVLIGGAMIYIGDLKSDVQLTKSKQELDDIQDAKVIEKLDRLLIAVGQLEGANKEKNNE